MFGSAGVLRARGLPRVFSNACQMERKQPSQVLQEVAAFGRGGAGCFRKWSQNGGAGLAVARLLVDFAALVAVMVEARLRLSGAKLISL